MQGVPKLYPKTFRGRVGDFLMVYNPLSSQGISVLNKEASFLFNLIDGEKTIQKIFKIAQKKDADITLADLKSIFEKFIDSEIVYFKKPKRFKFDQEPTQLGVWLHLTNKCNLRCSYCYVAKSKEVMSRSRVQKAICQVFTAAKNHKFKKIKFKFSGGEPLLEMSLLMTMVAQAQKLAQKEKIIVDFMVLTNGVLLTPKVAKTFKKNRLRVAVSLDGLGKFHDHTRKFANGQGSFKQVEKGIRNLKKEKVPFNVSVTITSQNVTNLPTMTDYFLKKKFPFVLIFTGKRLARAKV